MRDKLLRRRGGSRLNNLTRKTDQPHYGKSGDEFLALHIHPPGAMLSARILNIAPVCMSSLYYERPRNPIVDLDEREIQLLKWENTLASFRRSEQNAR